MFGITVKLPPGHVGELTVNSDDDSACMGDGSGSFRRHFPRRIRMTCDLVDVVRHGPDKTLQRRELHELIPPLRRILCALAERRLDQKPRDGHAVLLRQGEELGFLLRADLDLMTVHTAAVNIRPAAAGFPTGEAVAFSHLSRPSFLASAATRNILDQTSVCRDPDGNPWNDTNLARLSYQLAPQAFVDAVFAGFRGWFRRTYPRLRVGAQKQGCPMARVDDMPTIDIEQTRNQARALLDSRIESVTSLVKTRQRIADLREQLTEAEREDKRAYVRATKDGWSPEELKKLGLESGAVARRRKTTTRPAGDNAAGTLTETSGQD